MRFCTEAAAITKRSVSVEERSLGIVNSRAACSEIGRLTVRESVMASNDFLLPPAASQGALALLAA